MLSVNELKTLIKAHNKLSQIKIPPRATQEGLIKLIESAGYKVDHEKKVIKPTVKRGKQITLKQAEEVSKPKVKTELQKQKLKEKKEMKMEEEKKKIRMAKKEAVEQFKKSQKQDLKLKPISKLKKEDETRPKEKVGKPRVDPKKIKVIVPKKKEEPKKEEKLYEKEYNEFLKMFNEAKERRSRTPFLKLRDRILNFNEPILVGTPSFKVQEGARLKALKEPFMKKIQDILENVDTEIKKYVDIGKKSVGGLKTRPKKEIKISNKPALNTKKIEPKIDKKQIDNLSLQYIKEIKKMSPLKTLSNIQSTFKKYYKKIYDFIGTSVDNYEELRKYWDDNWSDIISEAIPDGRKKPKPKPKE